MEESLKLTKTQLTMLNATELAYIGDSVYEAEIRKGLLLRGLRTTDRLAKKARFFVSAPAQSKILEDLEPLLREDETIIVNRAKNAKLNKTPKNATPKEYAEATALESLFGYLCLSEQHGRIDELIRIIFDNKSEKI